VLSRKQFLAQKSNDFWLFPGKKSDDDTESCSTAGVPEMFPTVAALLG